MAALRSKNEDIAQHFTKAFASGDVAALQEIVAEDVLVHNAPPGSPQGLLGAVARSHAWRPDVAITVEQPVVQGDLVAQYGCRDVVRRRLLLGPFHEWSIACSRWRNFPGSDRFTK